MADLEDKKVSQLESGTVTSNSVFLDSGNGVSTKVGSQDIANFVGKTHVFSDLNTTSKRLVGAINEVAGSAGKSNLADMDDVNIDDQTLTGGQTIIYDDTNDEWVNGDVASTLESLTDVDIDSTSLEDGQGLIYDETNDKWVNGTVSGGASVVQKTMAEYTALPSADKMNGSIYKITDKALIYCLDEEYHALKEITSADYALLSSAEKNNGTLYILTDEETTADDIPYSSGVSVADALTEKMNHIKDMSAASSGHPASTDYIPLSDGTNEYKASVGEIGKVAVGAVIKYMDISDTSPVNIKGRTGNKVVKDNFINAISLDYNIVGLLHFNGDTAYMTLKNSLDMSAVTGTHNVRVWYIDT